MMYKYIGCEALLNALKEERKNGNFVFTSKWIKEIIDNLPYADVVPKSEVERLEGELIVESTRRKNAVNAYHDAKTEVAREIFEEIEKFIVRRMIADRPLIDDRLITDIAELKKKYVGE